MTASDESADGPMAEPLKPPSGGAKVVGAGGGDAGAAGTPRDNDDDDEWRHPPVAPVDEKNPLRSLGEAVGDVVSGSDSAAPKR